MKYRNQILPVVIYCLISVVGLGCARIKEMGKGFAGVSTQVLEDNRKDALKKSFALDYDRCYSKVKEILNQKDKESYIYAQDAEERLIATYFSLDDTTPVGIFFTESGGETLVEVSSPSTYAKEEIASRIFSGLSGLTNPGSKENMINAKEKTSN
ncbi:MAG: hypothetical protein PHS66_03045 [Candidatus Omnitrophica bacterium]|nr:hypothetical protein [Candidatus Omnitrophota bacterium]